MTENASKDLDACYTVHANGYNMIENKRGGENDDVHVIRDEYGVDGHETHIRSVCGDVFVEKDL